jgi:hypothetical protein
MSIQGGARRTVSADRVAAEERRERIAKQELASKELLKQQLAAEEQHAESNARQEPSEVRQGSQPLS